jgi:hypothetical protein
MRVSCSYKEAVQNEFMVLPKNTMIRTIYCLSGISQEFDQVEHRQAREHIIADC